MLNRQSAQIEPTQNQMNKLKILKTFKILLLIIFIPTVLIYLGVILPEYLACCDEHKNTTNMGIDFLGNQVDCMGDNQVFGKVFFQFSPIIVVGFSIILLIV